MTGPDDQSSTRPISVAELLAKNGTIGAPPVGGRRRRRRGNADSVTVAELTGEIPVIRTTDTGSMRAVTDFEPDGEPDRDEPVEAPADLVEAPVDGDAEDAGAAIEAPEPVEDDTSDPAIEPIDDAAPEIEDLDTERALADDAVGEDADQDRATGAAGDEAESAGSEAESAGGVAEGVGDVADDPPGDVATDTDTDTEDDEHDDAGEPRRMSPLVHGAWVVAQSVLAVVFGAGLFVAFDQLWKWNNIVALVLSVLVILGLVVGVRVVRKTEDIGSTLIAVAVGALVTLGPLALLQSG